MQSMALCAAIMTATAPAAPEEYSTIKPRSLLSADFKKRTTNFEQLQNSHEFQLLIKEKISHFVKKGEHYAYSSEGVNDTRWGCAWRAIQTALSAEREVPGFKELFETYGSRNFLEKQYRSMAELYDNTQSWISPHSEWHMWADPFVGAMILHSHNIDTKLIALNSIPKMNSPKVAHEIVRFAQFKDMLVTHFKTGGHPIVLDNGSIALNIIGIGVDEKTDRTFLLIADPHLKFDRDSHSLNGIYTVELNSEGKVLKRDYPAEHNHDYHAEDGYSFDQINFSNDTSWIALFPKIK